MAVHIEWVRASDARVGTVHNTAAMSDEDFFDDMGGGAHERPAIGCHLLTLDGDDCVAIEGTVAELRRLAERLTHAVDALDRADNR